MKIDIETLPEQRIAAVAHVGPYPTIGDAFTRVGEIAGRAGLFAHPGAFMVGVFHDDPKTTPAAALRSHAGVLVPAGIAIPPELETVVLPAGKYARATHEGPYAGLPASWAQLMGKGLSEIGHRGTGFTFELYRNHPGEAKPADLRTELYVSIA